MSMDLAVVFSPVGGGHKAAALAVAEAAQNRGLSVALIDAFAYAPRVFGDVYVGTHLTGQRVAPAFYGSVYDAANARSPIDPLRRGIDRLALARFERHVRALAPRAIVATHHLPLVVLGRSRRRGRIDAPVLGVVTDYTSHVCWAEAGVDRFCVPCATAQRELEARGIPSANIERTGIPVRPSLDAIAAVENPRANEKLRVLVTSGGFGVGPIRRVIRSFSGARDVHLTIVCGASTALFEQAHADAVAARVETTIVGFERDMPARLAAAHLVIGKAGGLTVSEALTAGRAMIVVGTVPGNETRNEEHVVRGGAGCAASPSDAGRIARTLRDRGEIAAMGARARGLVRRGAADAVVDAALFAGASLRRTAA